MGTPWLADDAVDKAALGVCLGDLARNRHLKEQYRSANSDVGLGRVRVPDRRGPSTLGFVVTSPSGGFFDCRAQAQATESRIREVQEGAGRGKHKASPEKRGCPSVACPQWRVSPHPLGPPSPHSSVHPNRKETDNTTALACGVELCLCRRVSASPSRASANPTERADIRTMHTHTHTTTHLPSELLFSLLLVFCCHPTETPFTTALFTLHRVCTLLLTHFRSLPSLPLRSLPLAPCTPSASRSTRPPGIRWARAPRSTT